MTFYNSWPIEPNFAQKRGQTATFPVSRKVKSSSVIVLDISESTGPFMMASLLSSSIFRLENSRIFCPHAHFFFMNNMKQISNFSHPHRLVPAVKTLKRCGVTVSYRHGRGGQRKPGVNVYLLASQPRSDQQRTSEVEAEESPWESRSRTGG